MNVRHRRTLAAIFSRPTAASIPFADIEALILAHPGKEARRYQVEEACELLMRAGVAP
jgi:hypothetical protein